MRVGETGVGEMGVGETGQIIGKTGVGETGVGEMGVNQITQTCYPDVAIYQLGYAGALHVDTLSYFMTQYISSYCYFNAQK